MNSDFLDMLSALSAEAAEFLVVGAFAMAAHGYVRSTGDLDVWVRHTPENAGRVWRALGMYGAPLAGLHLTDLTEPDVVFRIGVPPRQIDILTTIAGVEFDEAWARRSISAITDVGVCYLSRELLIVNKKATGRPRDLADAIWLEGSP